MYPFPPKPFAASKSLVQGFFFISIQSFFIFLLLLSAGNHLSAQKLAVKGPKVVEEKDSVLLLVKDLPPLDTLAAVEVVFPYYRYLWIFGDGNFINGTREDTLYHRFFLPPGTGNADKFEVRVYSTDTYSGGDPPPKIKSDNVDGLKTDSAAYAFTQAIEKGYLRLQKNHEVRPEDSLVCILSFKNNLDIPLSGQLYLFFNSLVNTVSPKGEKGKTLTKPTPEFGKFHFQESMVYYDNIDPNTYFIRNVPNTLGGKFQKGLVYNYSNLRLGQEQHLFVEYAIDSLLGDFIKGNQMGKVSFLAVMTGFTQEDDLLSDADRTALQELGIFGFLDTLSELGPAAIDPVNPSVGTEGLSVPFNSFNNDIATNVVGYFEMEASLVKAHDPNYMRVDACECPGKDEVHKLIISVECENDGFAPTTNVFIDIKIPEELDFKSIYDSLISVHPLPSFSGKVELSKDPAGRTVRWSLLNYMLLSTREKGVGDPATRARIVFSVLTNPGLQLTDIPPMQACIRFIDKEDEQVCTLPVNVTPIPASADEQGLLECSDCSCPPSLTRLLIILAVVLLFILIAFLLRRNNSGN